MSTSSSSSIPTQGRGTLLIKWDPKNLEIRTKSVEKALEPLVTKVTTLVNSKGGSGLKKGRSKKAHVLAAAVEKATQKFIERGEEIAKENPEVEREMMAAVEDVKLTGEAMRVASNEFANDPCSSTKRGNMVRAARALLSAVTRLLIIADMVDVHLLLKSLKIVEYDIERVRAAQTQQELVNSFKTFGRDVMELEHLAHKRQIDLKDPRHRDDMAAARATLKKNSMMLLTASKAYVRHPDVNAARDNRDYALRQVSDAVNTISNVTQASGPSQPRHQEGPGELAAALDEFDARIVMDPMTYNEARSRPSLEERLESIISGAALMADSSCTRDDRRERIVAECNAVRQALQDLLSEYISNAGKRDRGEPLDTAIDRMTKKTKDLRKQLRKAVVDHVSDSFLETNVPLIVLIEAAKTGNEREVEEYANVFREHASKLVEVANLACSMSNNEDGVKLVRYAAQQLENLCPQVINAARTLAARPRSKVAQENMDVFKASWETQVKVLTEAVDDITTIDDFLAVSESHILEDVNKCVLALQEKDADTLDRTAGAIRGRSARVGNVVGAEMQNYEPGVYTDKVMHCVLFLKENVLPKFSQFVELAVDALSSGDHIDDDQFIDSARLVYDAIRDIRRAVLMNRNYDELDSDTEIEFYEEEYDYDMKSKSSYITEEGTLDAHRDSSYYDSMTVEGRSDRALMRQLPHDEREKIKEQVMIFQEEKRKLDVEVEKWDPSGNDIIVIAKKMCVIMMEMTDFTRGRGPLKTTMDVINAAQRISELGETLIKIATEISDYSVESMTKNDLLTYLKSIALYCHQLNITSKVKADVQNVSGELIVSGLDSATSLITAAKNLMTTVVQTVKASYVASTKYKKQTQDSVLVVWKMKAPEKKPLVKRDKPTDYKGRVRRGSQKKAESPIKALSDFRGAQR